MFLMIIKRIKLLKLILNMNLNLDKIIKITQEMIIIMA